MAEEASVQAAQSEDDAADAHPGLTVKTDKFIFKSGSDAPKQAKAAPKHFVFTLGDETSETDGASAHHIESIVQASWAKQAPMTAETADITEIQLDYLNDEIELVPVEGTKLTVTEAFRSFRTEYAGTLTQTGSVLRVQHGVRPRANIRISVGGFKIGFWSQIKVGIPASFHGKLLVTNSDGNIAGQQLPQLAGATLTAKDGNINLSQLDVDQLTVQTIDGNLSLRQVQAANLLLNNRDGNLKLESGHVGNLTVRMTDGHITLQSVQADGAVHVTTQDGNVAVRQLQGQDIFIESKDGRLDGDSIEGTRIQMLTHDGSIRATNLAGKTQLHTDDGHIKASWQRAQEDVDVSAELSFH